MPASTPTSTAPYIIEVMRILVACEGCKRQYDAGELPSGSLFHCRCGATVRVPHVRARDAAVVRCSSCGGPRSEGESACRYCHVDFTLHEQDLETMCPGCFARVSSRARFCHHCGLPIVPEGLAGADTDRTCPACGEGRPLRSRTLGSGAVSMLECTRCAGIWLSRESFDLVIDRARGEVAAEGTQPPQGRSPERARSPAPRGPLYRRCPVCGEMMSRFNYGKRSGTILDSCRDHGVWCDAHELEAILRWMREGGEERARQEALAEAREDPGSKFFRQKLDRMASGSHEWQAASPGADIGNLLASLFDS